MKKLILLLTVALISLNSFSQLRLTWLETDSTNTDKLVLNGTEMDNDSIRHAERSDTADLALEISQYLTDLTIYISEDGSDVTGDGTELSPYATMLKAAQETPKYLINMTLTYKFDSGTYTYDDNFVNEISKIHFNNSKFNLKGDTTILYNNFTISEEADTFMVYNVTASGVTVTENELKGKFINISGAFYPISWNSAGTGTFRIEFAREGQSGTYEIVEISTDINLWNDHYPLDWNLIGQPYIITNTINLISNSSKHIRFEKNQSEMFFDYGTSIILGSVRSLQYGTYNDAHRYLHNFRGAYLYANGIDMRNIQPVILLFASSVVDFTNGYAQAGNLSLNGKNAIVTLDRSILVGNGSNFALEPANECPVFLKRTVNVRNFLSFFQSENGYAKVLAERNLGEPSYLQLFNTSYLIGTPLDPGAVEAPQPNNMLISLDNFKYDANYLANWQPNPPGGIPGYIDLEKNIIIQISGLDPTITFKDSDIDTIMPDTIPNKEYVDSYFSGSLTDGAPTESEINSITGLTPATAGYNRQLLIFDTDGTGLYYDMISTGTSWIWFPGKTGTIAL